MEPVIVDAAHHIVGRLASRAAKELLNGKTIIVTNAADAIISGNPTYTIRLYREKVQRGDPYHGPFYPKTPDRMVRRIVRGMLPKNERGRAALQRLVVYNAVPAALQGKETISYAEATKTLAHNSLTLGILSERLGGKKTW